MKRYPYYVVQTVSARGLRELYNERDLDEAQRWYEAAKHTLAPRTSVRLLKVDTRTTTVLRNSAKEDAP